MSVFSSNLCRFLDTVELKLNYKSEGGSAAEKDSFLELEV